MAEATGMGLHFEATLDDEQIKAAIDETLRRIQGLSDGTAAGGKEMEAAFRQSTQTIADGYAKIDWTMNENKSKIEALKAEYRELGIAAGGAFSKEVGGSGYLTDRQQAIKGEITMRRQLIKETEENATALDKVAEKQAQEQKKVEQNAATHTSLRTQIRAVREEMALLVNTAMQNGETIDETKGKYAELKNELGRLVDIQKDVQQQGNVLANDEAAFQGIISGISGIAGGFSAATGAISLFAGENEDLQKVMTKVQSVMAITIGLQQVAQTLNKDSAFQLVTMNKLKAWWAGITAKATAAQVAETVAETADTVAKKANTIATQENAAAELGNAAATGVQTVAAGAGTVANWSLASAFRAVGLALKSIPVFGWIIAGLTAIVGIYTHFSIKANEAKKSQEELNQKIIESAAKPVGSIIQLKNEFNSLGNNMQAKEKFIKDNAKVFDELGLSIRNVADAERLLSDPAHVKKFIQAQINKARATAITETDSFKKALNSYTEINEKIEKAKASKEAIRKTNSPHASTYMYNKDIEISEYEKQLKPFNDVLEDAYSSSIKATQAYNKQMEDINKESNDKLKGTIAGQRIAIKDDIEKLEAMREKLSVNDKKGLSSINKKIDKERKKLEKIDGKEEKSSSSSKSKTEKDPFLEKLKKQKEEYDNYLKYVNSGDETLKKAAEKKFEELKKKGVSYVDYLKKQQETLLKIDAAKRTKEQNKQLETINNQLAEEAKNTVLEAFNKELNEQLGNAKSVIEMLNIIEEKRKTLSNDGTDLDNSKKESIDKAAVDVNKKAKAETDTLIQNYSSYLQKKIDMEMQYSRDLELLQKRREAATTDAERAEIDRVIANRKDKYDKDKKGSGDADYDAMVKEYATFEQKKQNIIEEFDEKRKKAVEQGDTQLVEQLNKAQAKALSSLTLNELQTNPNWEKMFGNLDELTTQKLEELLAMFENTDIFLGVQLDPKDLEVIKDKINAVKNEVQERNPFKALISSIKEYGEATDKNAKKAALTKSFEAAAASLDLIKGGFDAVVGGLDELGLAGDETTKQMLGDISEMIGAAGELAKGIATGNPLDIIKGSIGLITSALKVFNFHDRKADRQIKQHAENLKNLERTYNQLEKAIDKALGSGKYTATQNAIRNLEQQQRSLAAQAALERNKKKSDQGKVQEYEDALIAAKDKQLELIEQLRTDILGLDAKSAAEQLGDAFIEAFSKGENAVEAFGKKTDDIVAGIMKKMLIQKLLEQPLGNIFERYSKRWYDDSGNFLGFDSVMKDANAMGAEIKGLADGFSKGMETLPDEIKKYFIGDKSKANENSLAGAVKGVSEETASMLGGQINAVRINQMESTQLLRQQLMYLAVIAQNTSYNKYLESIDDKISKINNVPDTLRPKGVGN